MSEKETHKHKSTYYNDIALRLAHKLFGVEHLHYGFFTGNQKWTLDDVPAAQAAYVKNLLTYVPKDVKEIFDVGCGSGGVARQLINKKYRVICLAPDPYLIQKTLDQTDGRVGTITDLYENVQDVTPESFDMILMSESCQYIKVKEGWQQNSKFLRSGGYVLVADFFKIREIDRKGVSKSGHRLSDFLQEAEVNGFRLLKKVDITKQIAPTMDIYQEIILDKIFPVFEAIFELVSRRYPIIYRILRSLFGKKVGELKEKYSNQGAEIFQKYKGYYILLFKKIS